MIPFGVLYNEDGITLTLEKWRGWLVRLVGTLRLEALFLSLFHFSFLSTLALIVISGLG